MADDPVAQYLKTLHLSDAVRAAAWDATYAADDTAAEAGLRKLPKYLAPQVLENLWNLRQGGTLTGDVAPWVQPSTEQFAPPTGPQGTASERFWSNLGAQVDPRKMVSGIWNAIQTPEAVGKTVESIYNASAGQARQAAEAYREGRTSEMVAHGLATFPILGPAAAAAGEQIGSGDIAGGVGTGVGLIGSVLAPSGIKAVGATRVGTAARTAAADALEGTAVRLARAGVKAPIAILKKQAGASATGVNFQATKLAQFLIDNRLTTPGQAARIIKNTEAEIQALLRSQGGAPTDAPLRAQLYLDIFEKQAAKSLKPDHAAIVRAAAAELLEGPLGETVTTTVLQPTGRTSSTGKPILTPVQQTSRQLRASVPADEALPIARATSQFETGRAWGEQKGTAMEATKISERAVRDAFKQAIPEARTPLERQGQAMLAEKVLDRQVWRELNRDVVSLPGLVGMSVNAVVGFAAHWLRNNQLRAGIWTNDLAHAIATNNAAAAAGILSRLKVRLPALGPLLAEFGAPGVVGSPVTTGAQAAPPGAQSPPQ